MGSSRHVLAFGFGLLLLGGFASAEEQPEQAPAHVQGVIYEVFHGDSIHRMGFYAREVYLPRRGFSFNVVGGELRVFRPDPIRYALEGATIRIPDPAGDGEIELPVLALPSTAPKRIGEIRIPAEHADRLEEHLREKTRLRAMADTHLLDRGEFRPVAGCATSNRAAADFICDLLDKARMPWLGVGNAGGDTISVPEARAEEARALLRVALVEGLHRTTKSQLEDRRFDYAVLGKDGIPEWFHERALVPPTPPEADVLEHLARFPGSEVVVGGGTRRQPKYGDLDLEQAERTLDGTRPRPWTVPRLRTWYEDEATTDESVRAALVTLLAASRSPDALPLVGAALTDASLDVRVAATYAILKWWDPRPGAEGGTEQAMEQAFDWWKAHQRAAAR